MAYVYQDLLPDNTTRLLELSPGAGNSQLEAHLRVVKIDDGVTYEALSYVWGKSRIKKRLIVDGRSLLISDNLYSILVQLRRSNAVRTLWVDAICINQGDITERSAQVSMMGQIYRQADTVICWLGDASTDRSLGLEFLQSLASKAYQYIEVGRDGDLWPAVEDQVVGYEDMAATLASALAAHIEAVYDSPWFTRLWISQEVSLAHKPIVFCGTNNISWKELEMATRVLACCYRHEKSIAPLPSSINRAWSLIHTKSRYKLISRSADIMPIHIELDTMWSLGRLAWESRHQHCEDDRDRVYALLSLVSAGSAYGVYSPKPFTPDYNRSVEWAYGQFWARFGGYSSLFQAGLSRRRDTGTPDLSLHSLGGGMMGYKEGTLPSWCPDLRPHANIWKPIFTSNYAASTPMHHMESHRGTATGPGPLMIRGHRFDKVSFGFHMSRKFDPHSDLKDIVELREIVKMLVALQFAYGPYLSGQVWIDALGFALLTDMPSGPTKHDHPFQSCTSERLTHEELKSLWHSYLRDFISDTGTTWVELESHLKACIQTQLSGKAQPDQKFQFDPSTQFTEEQRLIWKLHEYIGEVLKFHRFILTKYNWMGLAPPDTAPGDMVVVLGGPGTAFVVRDTGLVTMSEIVPRTYESINEKILSGKNATHTDMINTDTKTPVSQLLGPCYLQGIMNGELYLEERYEKLLEWETDRAGQFRDLRFAWCDGCEDLRVLGCNNQMCTHELEASTYGVGSFVFCTHYSYRQSEAVLCIVLVAFSSCQVAVGVRHCAKDGRFANVELGTWIYKQYFRLRLRRFQFNINRDVHLIP